MKSKPCRAHPKTLQNHPCAAKLAHGRSPNSEKVGCTDPVHVGGRARSYYARGPRVRSFSGLQDLLRCKVDVSRVEDVVLECYGVGGRDSELEDFKLGDAVLESEVRFQILGLGRVKCRAAVIMFCWILSWYSCRGIVLLELIPLVDVYDVSLTSVREGRSCYSGWRCSGLRTP